TACACVAQSIPTENFIAPPPGTARHCAVRGPAGRSLIGALACGGTWRVSLWPVWASRRFARGSAPHSGGLAASDAGSAVSAIADTRRLVLEAARRGADVVELGVPFSDPLADGPVIQRAAMRALDRGTTLPRVLETVATLRAETNVPIALLTYYSPVLAFGLK